jgi:hypothetical protein
VLFDHLEIAQIVVDRNAGIIYKNVKGIYFGGCPLNLRGARHVQSYRRHLFIRMSDCVARTRIYPLRATLECLFDESSANAPVGAGDKDRFICDSHVVFAFLFCFEFLSSFELSSLMPPAFGRHLVPRSPVDIVLREIFNVTIVSFWCNSLFRSRYYQWVSTG